MDANTQDYWNTTLQIAEKQLGSKQNGQKPLISDETWNFLKKRKKAKGLLNAARTRNEKRKTTGKYEDLNKQAKRSARTDKRSWVNNLASQAETAAQLHNTLEVYGITRHLINKNFNSSRSLKNKQGTLLSHDDKQLES